MIPKRKAVTAAEVATELRGKVRRTKSGFLLFATRPYSYDYIRATAHWHCDEARYHRGCLAMELGDKKQHEAGASESLTYAKRMRALSSDMKANPAKYFDCNSERTPWMIFSSNFFTPLALECLSSTWVSQKCIESEGLCTSQELARMTTYTTTTAAKRLNCHPETVKRHCREHGIGNLISTRLRILDAADLKRLRKLVQRKGRPRKR